MYTIYVKYNYTIIIITFLSEDYHKQLLSCLSPDRHPLKFICECVNLMITEIKNKWFITSKSYFIIKQTITNNTCGEKGLRSQPLKVTSKFL